MISLLSLFSGTEKPSTLGGKSFIPLLNHLLSNLLLHLSLLRYACVTRIILSSSLPAIMSVCPLVSFHMVDFLTCYFALRPIRRACAVPAVSSLHTPCVSYL